MKRLVWSWTASRSDKAVVVREAGTGEGVARQRCACQFSSWTQRVQDSMVGTRFTRTREDISGKETMGKKARGGQGAASYMRPWFRCQDSGGTGLTDVTRVVSEWDCWVDGVCCRVGLRRWGRARLLEAGQAGEEGEGGGGKGDGRRAAGRGMGKEGGKTG